jgi:hypothetical protein
MQSTMDQLSRDVPEMLSEKTRKTKQTINPIVERTRKRAELAFQKTPSWFQRFTKHTYERARRYQLLSDFTTAFSLLFVVPVLIWLSWSAGSLLVTSAAGIVIWTITNCFLVGSGFLLLGPFAAFAFFASLFIAFWVTIARLSYKAFCFIYDKTMSFLGDHGVVNRSSLFSGNTWGRDGLGTDGDIQE